MKSHTGGLMTMGTGGYYVQYRKHKLNTNISTEADLIRVDDVLIEVIWTRYFLKEQGHTIQDNVIYKDNQSTIRIEKW